VSVDHDRPQGSTRFPETSWGLVVAARGNASDTRAAFAELCRRYWMPIYASLRRQGFDSAEAEDLVQGFFLRLIEHDTVTRADRERGRFRSFLLGALRRFLASEDERESAIKRGGDCRFVPFEATAMEALMPVGGDEAFSLDLQFDREWARALVDHALALLREEHVRSGHAELFESMQPCLDPGANAPSYAELALRLERNEGAVKTVVHRLRRRFREILRREVACTVVAAQDVDDELAYLRDVLSAEAAAS
jgi:RNA polymerase sigma-70 factor (ECF subfamily)